MTELEIALTAALGIALVVHAFTWRAYVAAARSAEVWKSLHDQRVKMTGMADESTETWRRLVFSMLADSASRSEAVREEAKALLAEVAPAGVAYRCKRIVDILDAPAPAPEERA